MIKRAFWLFVTFVAVLLVLLCVLFKLFPMDYAEMIKANAEKEGLSPALIAAQIKAESNFDKNAESHKGAMGLMQILPATADWCAKQMGKNEYSEQMLKNAKMNIEIGTWYLSYLLNKTGNISWALAAYNGGIANVEAWRTDGIESIDAVPFPETVSYVKKVLLYEKVYAFLYNFRFSH